MWHENQELIDVSGLETFTEFQTLNTSSVLYTFELLLSREENLNRATYNCSAINDRGRSSRELTVLGKKDKEQHCQKSDLLTRSYNTIDKFKQWDRNMFWDGGWWVKGLHICKLPKYQKHSPQHEG